ncbi:MAG TPA: DUF2089 domain-containing protein [Nitrolancea sp.]|nr:DUF2089 domain-containing protein [Nitrolancea sp.]
MYKAPSHCPTCGHVLEIRELNCQECDTTIRGRWPLGVFDRLTVDQQTFLRLFVRSRGNLSEVERSLGVSYPTVRAKLEEVIEALQEEPAPAPETPSQQTRDDILQAIAAGRLSVEDGLARLRSLETRKEQK